MRIRITKGGIFGAQGEIAVGTEIDVKDEPSGWAGRYDVISSGGKGKTAVTNPTADQNTSLVAKDAGSGWWAIVDADGKEVGKKMREADAKAFNDLSDADKLAFVNDGA